MSPEYFLYREDKFILVVADSILRDIPTNGSERRALKALVFRWEAQSFREARNQFKISVPNLLQAHTSCKSFMVSDTDYVLPYFTHHSHSVQSVHARLGMNIERDNHVINNQHVIRLNRAMYSCECLCTLMYRLHSDNSENKFF